MKRFEDLLSPLSWAFLACFLPLFFVLLRPTPFEFLVFFAVDYLSLLVIRRIDRRLFLRIYPDATLYFIDDNVSGIRDTSLDERIALFRSMVRFPMRRAVYSVWVSFLKTLPGTLVIVFFWHHSGSNLGQALKVCAIGANIFTYMFGAVFIENHALISRRIAEIHQRFNWSDVFRHVDVGLERRNFQMAEALSLGSLWVFVIALQVVLVTVTRRNLALQVAGIGIAGLLLFARVWYLGRQYFLTGLEKLFERLEVLNPEATNQLLPLHSSSALAPFGKVVNSLCERLQAYKAELSRWVHYQAEESRYRALGEISALVVHDLSAPLHVIQFCSRQLQEEPERKLDPRYLEQLSVNAGRALELIESLKAYLKEGKRTVSGVSFGEAHDQVVRLLETQFQGEGFHRTEFRLEEAIRALTIDIPRADLIHVLFNLYRNSLENLIQNRIPHPVVSISTARHEAHKVTLNLRDNGTGLTQRRFEELTAFAFLPEAEDAGGRDGLGLRLVRRLVERNGGTLRALDVPEGDAGAWLQLQLTVVSQAAAEGESRARRPPESAEKTGRELEPHLSAGNVR